MMRDMAEPQSSSSSSSSSLLSSSSSHYDQHQEQYPDTDSQYPTASAGACGDAYPNTDVQYPPSTTEAPTPETTSHYVAQAESHSRKKLKTVHKKQLSGGSESGRILENLPRASTSANAPAGGLSLLEGYGSGSGSD